MIDLELRKILQEHRELIEENNKLLHKMYRASIWGRVFRVLYWVAIIGVTVGTYYFIQPMFDNISQRYTKLLGGVESLQEAGNSIPNMLDLLKPNK